MPVLWITECAMPVSLENELAALQLCQSLLQSALDSYPTTLALDEHLLAAPHAVKTSEQAAPSADTDAGDLHSALVYRITQKRVIVQQQVRLRASLAFGDHW